MDLTKAVKEKYKKPLASCTNEEIYICLLEQVKKLAKEKEAASKITAATSKRKLYYISAEFLIGKLLSNNLINLVFMMKLKKSWPLPARALPKSRSWSRSHPSATAVWDVWLPALWIPLLLLD